MKTLVPSLLVLAVLVSSPLTSFGAGFETIRHPIFSDTHSAWLRPLETAVTSREADKGLHDFLYWPTGHPVVIPRRFDPPAQKWLPGHRGIDLRVSPGDTVFAATDATVLFAGELAGRPVVSLEDSTGRRYTYEPVEPSVCPDDKVSRGDPIGTALGGHFPGDNRLHFGVKDGPEGYVDPLKLLGGRIRLWPLD